MRRTTGEQGNVTFFLQIVTLFSYANMLFKSGRQKGLSWPFNGEEGEWRSGHLRKHDLRLQLPFFLLDKRGTKMGLAENEDF